MPLPIFTPPAIIAPHLAPNQETTFKSNQKLNEILVSSTPTTSPVKAKSAPTKIAQSELPGGSTPPPAPTAPTAPTPTAPPEPSIRDTGSGYPSRIPANYFGPALSFGNGNTSFGVISRFPFGNKLSIRPAATFGNITSVRVPVTYDFALGDPEPFERNPLITFNAGAGVQYISGNNKSNFAFLGTIGVDVNLFEGTALVGNYSTDFSNNNTGSFGLGFEF
jgi:hypothetical protein